MARSRHAMRVHPLRSKGVVVGVPVAAAVAFGAHAVLGVVPLSDQSPSSSSAPRAVAPVQSYGLAPTPPPTTLGLLSQPSTTHGAASDVSTSGTSHSSGSGGSRSAGSSSTVPIAAGSVPVAHAASAPAGAAAPSVLSFTPASAAPAAAEAPAVDTHEAAPQAAALAAAPAATSEATSTAAAEHDDSSDEQSSSGGGSLLGVDLGVAKVSVLSFGG